MSRIERSNFQRGGSLSQKLEAMKGESGKGQLKELTFDSVKEDAIRFGLATEVLCQMSAGKEASIFLALWKQHPIVLKAYRLWHSSHKISKKSGYISQTTGKKTHCILGIVEDLAFAEFETLSNCHKAGVPVPTPIGRVGNYLTMRFIGDETEPAPQIKDVTLEEPDQVLDQILDDYLVMYKKAHYVHGDLSRYNILWWQSRPWIIDVPQSYYVGPWADMPRAEALLRRDIKNTLSYFETYGIYRDAEAIVDVFLSEYIPYNLRNYRELAREGGELI